MSSEASIKKLLQRYKEGACTPEEITLLEAWFRQVQQESKASGLLSAADEERLVQRLKENPRFREPVPVIPHPASPGWWKRFARMSAAVWIGIFLATGSITYFLVKNNRHGQVREPLAFREVSTASGQRLKLVLPDSSVVWLNSLSSLKYHPDFSRHREVQLQGEAFFDVTHDTAHPFTVKAGAALTKVYGTAFNIQAYGQTDELRISLQRGRIGIRYGGVLPDKEKILSPGQLLIYRDAGKQSRIIPENPANMGAWVSGKLIFRQVPLKEVLAQLEKQYHVAYSYPPTLKNVSVTAQFDQPSLEKVMRHLSFGWDIEFRRRGDTIYVK
ncbi:FecR family protein [Chitinophaga sp. 22620]|uniref:FecR family protein n=1 Tax=Chitinophaga sp. 22620 TaxID=3453952 RepID=UPI003F8631C2